MGLDADPNEPARCRLIRIYTVCTWASTETCGVEVTKLEMCPIGARMTPLAAEPIV